MRLKILNKILFFSSFLLLSCNSFYPITLDWQLEQNRVESWANFYQGLHEEHSQNWETALSYYLTSLEVDEENPRILLHIGQCLAMMGDIKKSKIFLDGAIKFAEERNFAKEKDYLFYFDIASCYHNTGQYDKAKELYKQCLVLFPKFKQARFALIALPESLEIEIVPKK